MAEEMPVTKGLNSQSKASTNFYDSSRTGMLQATSHDRSPQNFAGRRSFMRAGYQPASAVNPAFVYRASG